MSEQKYNAFISYRRTERVSDTGREQIDLRNRRFSVPHQLMI